MKTPEFLRSAARLLFIPVIAPGLCAAVASSASALEGMVEVDVTFENRAPEGGNYLTPPLIALHDGAHDLFDPGTAASVALERLAEDGDPAMLTGGFQSGAALAVVLDDIGPIAPGKKVTRRLLLPEMPGDMRYLSFASMVIPSNDAFIANDDPVGIQLTDADGILRATHVSLSGAMVWDAGTEVNDELPANTAFLGQAAPDTGVREDATILPHAGFKPSGSGGILDDARFASADFSVDGYEIARISVIPIIPDPVDVTLMIRNSAPENGGYLTPVWIGIHDGTFDLFDAGQPASAALERLAEDGDPTLLQAEFAASSQGSRQSVIASGKEAPVFAPGDERTMTLTVDRNSAFSRFLSFAAMVIPSNDAFIANDDPMHIPLFDAHGNVRTNVTIVSGAMVYDAGTETNDEIPENTAFLAQAAPDTGSAEGGVVVPHAGFQSPGSGGILDDSRFSGADFTSASYTVLSLSAFEQLFITRIARAEASLSLMWSGGEPPFTVEMSSMLQPDSWTPVMGGITARTAEVPVSEELTSAYVRVAEQPEPAETATFALTFAASWSSATHPASFPSNPHFSGLIGATHNSEVTFWQSGGLATPGIRSMAETGSKVPLTGEVEAAIAAGTARGIISGAGINPSPGTVSVTFTASREHPLLTLVAMIAPSPDWFIGVDGMELFRDGDWIEQTAFDLMAYDAGTDSGTTYTAPNAVTSPQSPITLLEEPAVQVNRSGPAFGTFMLQRIQ